MLTHPARGKGWLKPLTGKDSYEFGDISKSLFNRAAGNSAHVVPAAAAAAPAAASVRPEPEQQCTPAKVVQQIQIAAQDTRVHIVLMQMVAGDKASWRVRLEKHNVTFSVVWAFSAVDVPASAPSNPMLAKLLRASSKQAKESQDDGGERVLVPPMRIGSKTIGLSEGECTAPKDGELRLVFENSTEQKKAKTVEVRTDPHPPSSSTSLLLRRWVWGGSNQPPSLRTPSVARFALSIMDWRMPPRLSSR